MLTIKIYHYNNFFAGKRRFFVDLSISTSFATVNIYIFHLHIIFFVYKLHYSCIMQFPLFIISFLFRLYIVRLIHILFNYIRYIIKMKAEKI